MTINANLRKNAIALGIPSALLISVILLLKHLFIEGNEAMSIAVTIDLVLTIPLVYFLLIRKTEIPKTTILPVLIIGILIGTYFMPEESQSYLTLFKTWALPILEITILAFIALKVRSTIKMYKSQKGTSPDFYNALKSTCKQVLPKKLVLPFATEVAVFYYGFINWSTPVLKENEFSYHKKSSAPSLLIALIVIIGVETFAFHALLSRWSLLAAWIFSALSIYTAIQVFGILKTISKRPIAIYQDHLSLKYGILNEVDISFKNIESFKLSTAELEKDIDTKTLSPLGELEGHNVVVYVKNECQLVGLYGFKKSFKTIGFFVDDPQRFKLELAKASATES